MERLAGARQRYDWGSTTAVFDFLGQEPDGQPWAELWLGAHPNGPTHLVDASGDASPTTLEQLVAAEPQRLLGADVVRRFGPQLPYLLKVIAPGQVLSLQVHPSLEQAAEGYALENEAGIAPSHPLRNYKDPNHKPEMVLALEHFEAVAGFRAPRRAAEVLAGLESRLARRMRRSLVLNPTRFGIRQVFSDLVSVGSRPTCQEVDDLAAELAGRLGRGESPSRRVDANAVAMARTFPGDPGIAAALLLNPVTLRPGEALFVPAGSVHAYVSGLGVEIMASSDNVLRAGLTHKHVDVPELLRILDPTASPPTRIAPERVSRAVSTFYAPVDDFELSDVHLRDANVRERIRGVGPRTVVCLNGAAQLEANGQVVDVSAGQAVFVPSCDGPLAARGFGHLVQAAVP